MENNLAQYSAQMAVTSDKILANMYFSAEENDPSEYHDEIIYWLTRVQTLTAKYDLVEIYITDNDFEAAQNVLDSIPFWFRLSPDQQIAYDDYHYYYSFRKNLINSNRYLSQLNESEILELIDFVGECDNLAKALAQNALCHYYSICREENYEMVYSGGRLMNSAIHTKSTASILNYTVKISVIPNPVTDVAVLGYSLSSFQHQHFLTICDVTGREIKRFNITDHQGRLIWETGSVKDGLYYYFVKNSNTVVAKGKITVKK
jgi:hypothetical protein